MSAAATEARERLDHLLRLRSDEALEPAPPAALGLGPELEWDTGWVDKALEVEITVVYIADPRARDEAERSLQAAAQHDEDSAVLVGTNGGMLFYGRTRTGDAGDGERLARLRELAGRFGGAERDR